MSFAHFEPPLLVFYHPETLLSTGFIYRGRVNSNISDILHSYESKIKVLKEEMLSLPQEVKSFEGDKDKYIFIGEVKAKLALYEKDGVVGADYKNEKVDELKKELETLAVEPVEGRRALFIKALDETIQEYIGKTAKALENYGEYRASFNYEEKRLQLRKPKTDSVENIGSSSNHMFLHLFLFLGLHEIIAKRHMRHVAPFLIIDQFSRPYWGDGESKKESLDHTDISKVKTALNLLDSFISGINRSGGEFQMIVFEHINTELWQGLKHVQLVEEFRNGNALIPESLFSTGDALSTDKGDSPR